MTNAHGTTRRRGTGSSDERYERRTRPRTTHRNASAPGTINKETVNPEVAEAVMTDIALLDILDQLEADPKAVKTWP